MKRFNGTKDQDGSKKKCEVCNRELDRYYYDKIDKKVKCSVCYNTQ